MTRYLISGLTSSAGVTRNLIYCPASVSVTRNLIYCLMSSAGVTRNLIYYPASASVTRNLIYCLASANSQYKRSAFTLPLSLRK